MSVSWEHRPEITDESERFKLMGEEIKEKSPNSRRFRKERMIPIVSKWNMKKQIKATLACGSDD
jgi:hypothetical protein